MSADVFFIGYELSQLSSVLDLEKNSPETCLLFSGLGSLNPSGLVNSNIPLASDKFMSLLHGNQRTIEHVFEVLVHCSSIQTRRGYVLVVTENDLRTPHESLANPLGHVSHGQAIPLS